MSDKDNKFDEAVNVSNDDRKKVLRSIKSMPDVRADAVAAADAKRDSNVSKYSYATDKKIKRSGSYNDGSHRRRGKRSEAEAKIAHNDASLYKNAAKVTRKEETEMDIHEIESPKAHPSDADGAAKMALITSLSQKMQAMSKSSLVDFYNKVMASIGHEADPISSGAAAKNKASVSGSGVKESITELFGDETLSEEFKEKASTLFEAAVQERLVEKYAALEETIETKIDEVLQSVIDSLEESLDSYMDHVTRKWMKENKLAVESTLRAEVAEDFMRDLRQVFENNYISIPDEADDIVEDLITRVEDLEARLNESINENIELAQIIEDANVQAVFEEMTEGLTLTEVEKFKTLAEGVEFDGDLNKFEKKLKIVKEKYFPKGKKQTSDLTEDSEFIPEQSEGKQLKEETVVNRYAEFFRNKQ